MKIHMQATQLSLLTSTTLLVGNVVEMPPLLKEFVMSDG
jgi:hypothetical protein